MLIEAGAIVNRCDYHAHASLCYAVTNNNIECIRLLIKAGADVNFLCPLRYAAANGQIKCLMLLINEGADVNQVDDYCGGRTPFIWAVMNNQVECASVLIEAGADVNLCNPLHYAAEYGHVKCVMLLINGGANVNRIDDSCYKRMSLVLAVGNNHMECVRLLIDAGADVNGIDDYDIRTPLICAVDYNRIECASILIEAGADVNHRNGVLGFARSVEVIRLLLRSGAKINRSWRYSADKPAKELLTAAGYTRWRHSPKKADDLMGMCREVIREHLLKMDEHTHLFYRVTRLGLPAALVSYLVFDQTLDDDATVDNEEI